MQPREVKKGDACYHRNHGKDICTVLMVSTMDRGMGVKIQKAKVFWMDNWSGQSSSATVTKGEPWLSSSPSLSAMFGSGGSTVEPPEASTLTTPTFSRF
jgi:hypothetical protein